MGDSKVTIGRNSEGAAFVQYVVDRNKGIIADFKKYLESLEDEIFIAACDNFEIKHGEGALQELDILMEKSAPAVVAYMTEFKESVKDVVNHKIESLRDKYLV